jgi:hypothetical protein
MQALKHSAGFIAGISISVGFVLNMDDIIYGQLRRHLVQPVHVLTMKSKEELVFQDIKDLGKSASTLMS